MRMVGHAIDIERMGMRACGTAYAYIRIAEN
jgi:hypothetical protein